MIIECCVKGCPRVAYAVPRLICDTTQGATVSTTSLERLGHCQRHMEQVSLAQVITDELRQTLDNRAADMGVVLALGTIRIEWVLANPEAHEPERRRHG